MNQIFISYAHQDELRAQQMARKLRARKIDYFLAPKGIIAGDDFRQELREALREAKEIWVLLSPDSLKSEWVKTECGAAWVLGKRLVPILFRCSPQDLPDILAGVHCEDFDRLDKIIRESLKRKPFHLPDGRGISLRTSTFLFDIDGTVLGPLDGLDDGVGRQFLDSLVALAGHGCRFAFITGNDYDVQKPRILDPVTKKGIGKHIFCFSDGGSRAFDYSDNDDSFAEVHDYSSLNLMTPKQVACIT